MKAINAEEMLQITWVGIDVAKDSYDAAIYLPLDLNQKSRDILKLPNRHFERTPESLDAFHHWTFKIREQAGVGGGQMRVVMEATGRYSSELAGWFQEKMSFTRPAILNPKMVADYRKSLYPGNDTDMIAAAALARFGAERQPERKTEYPAEYIHLRELTRQRAFLVSQRTTANNRLKEVANTIFVADVQREVVATFEQAIEKIELEIKKCIEESDELRENIVYATSIKGIGTMTAATVFAECGPLNNYNSRQLSSYSGLSPFKHTSGTSVNATRITRNGPKQLRRALYMPVTAMLKCNPEMQAFRQRLLSRGRTRMQARCAIMRKTLILIRALVVNKTSYQKNFKQNISVKS
ncbi:MAG: IS110 family transposase [Victivallaceae bacterium]